MSNKSIAVIPARGGSKRLPNKNIVNLGNKPLIYWIIDAILQSRCFTRIIVNTDSNEIASVVEKNYNNYLEIYHRPKSLGTDTSTVLEAILQMMYIFGDDCKTISYFLPTCPFISYKDIEDGYICLINQNVDSVISVVKMSDPIQLAMKKVGENDMYPVFDNLKVGATNSRYIQQHYKPSGGFYMSTWKFIKENQNLFAGTIKGIEIPVERSVDIDTKLDLIYAESLLQQGII